MNAPIKKPERYKIRDEIEEIVKTNSIDRRRFREAPKNEYKDIIRRFYYTFSDYEKYKTSPDDLSFFYLRFRKDIKFSPAVTCDSWDDYINNIDTLIPDSENKRYYLILSQGWVYDGYIPEIISVLKETDNLLDDFYIVSKKYSRTIIHSDDGNCMYAAGIIRN